MRARSSRPAIPCNSMTYVPRAKGGNPARGVQFAICMREHYPKSGWTFLFTLIAVLLAAKFIFTSLFTRFAY